MNHHKVFLGMKIVLKNQNPDTCKITTDITSNTQLVNMIESPLGKPCFVIEVPFVHKVLEQKFRYRMEIELSFEYNQKRIHKRLKAAAIHV